MQAVDLNILVKMDIFENCTTAQVAALTEGSQKKTLKHRELLYRAGDQADTFSIVLEGALKLIKPTPLGDDIIVFFATPGDVIAALVMNHQQSTYPVSSVAMGPTEVIKIPRHTFTSNWSIHPGILQKINGILFLRMSEMHEQKAMAKAHLAPKIARQIISLVERFGGEEETILPIPLTRQEIADSLGASVESVIRVMSEWSQEGLIRTSERHIEIIRMDKIIELIRC
jgi:CRP/FNR family transcriptional regulator, nitrogen oxide reductase regulator